MRLPCRPAYNRGGARGGAGCEVIYTGCGVDCTGCGVIYVGCEVIYTGCGVICTGCGGGLHGLRGHLHGLRGGLQCRLRCRFQMRLPCRPAYNRGGARHDGGCGVAYTGCGVIYTGCEVTCNAGFGAGFRCVYHVDRRITAVAPAVAQAAGSST